MNDNFRFRESFRGYNRDDVNAYIEQINIVFSHKEAELRTYIAELEKRLETAVTPPLTDNESSDAENQLQEAKDEIQRLNRELSLASQIPVHHSEDIEKSKLYDSMSAQVGNILIVANNNADKILAEANLDAEAIRADAFRDAEKIKEDIEQQKSVLMTELDIRLKEISDRCVSEYHNILNEAQCRFSTFSESMKFKAEKLQNSFEEKSGELESTIFDDYSNNSQMIEG